MTRSSPRRRDPDPFTDEEDAIRRANATEYGLVALGGVVSPQCVFSRDFRRAMQVCEPA